GRSARSDHQWPSTTQILTSLFSILVQMSVHFRTIQRVSRPSIFNIENLKRAVSDRQSLVRLRSNAWLVALIGGLVTIVAYFAYPDVTSQYIIYSLLGKATVASIVMGIVLYRPKERLGWIFLAAAIACFSVGDDI